MQLDSSSRGGDQPAVMLKMGSKQLTTSIVVVQPPPDWLSTRRLLRLLLLLVLLLLLLLRQAVSARLSPFGKGQHQRRMAIF